MAGTDSLVQPLIALACNIIVVSGNVARYYRAKLLTFRRYIPLVILSVPMAWLGGRNIASIAIHQPPIWERSQQRLSGAASDFTRVWWV